jgi:tRNA-dihydrouridine synthase
MGIDSQHIVYTQTGHVSQEEGCAAVTLHARTAAQLYADEADWNAIGDLKQRLSIPVLGNGDVWEAADALRMMRNTHCNGVVIGRGCLGRPWLFRDLLALFGGNRPPSAPTIGQVVDTLLDHANRQVAWLGEFVGMRTFRRQAGWYTKGFRSSAALRQQLMGVNTIAELRLAVADLDRSAPFPLAALRARRCKNSGTQRVSLPPGYLEDANDETPPEEHECFDGG